MYESGSNPLYVHYGLSYSNSNPDCCIKRIGRHQVHIDFYFEERGGREWTQMCRFYFYELLLSVYLLIDYVVKM
jgi:hypothetical protein